VTGRVLTDGLEFIALSRVGAPVEPQGQVHKRQ
jgi:hypothetical protein